MADLSSILSSSTQLDSLIAQYRASLRTQQVGRYEDKKITLTARSNAVTELQTKLKSLWTTTKDLAKTGTSSLFQAFSAVSSQTSVLTASASSGSSVGTHAVQVSQLAKADAMVSARFTSAGTTITSAEMTAEEQTAGQATRQFRVLENGVVKSTVSVTLTAGETNSSILTKVAAAINQSTETSSVMSASVVSISSTESKLVLTSKSTGASHAVSLEDVSGTLLDNLGWNDSVVSGRSAVSSSTTPNDPLNAPGGYLYSSTSLLDSMFTVDGIAIRRETNAINDVLTGVSFDLKSVQQPTDSPVNIAVTVDRDKVKTRVEKFMTDFNAVIEYLNLKTSFDKETGQGQILAGDPSFVGMRTSLKEAVYSIVNGVSSGNPKLLAEIGITLDRQGKLSISDSTKFTDALQYDVGKVEQLFSASDGIAVRLNTYLESMVGTNGSIVSRKDSLTAQLKSVNEQITRVTERINKQVDRFRDDFVKAQALVATYTQQQAMVTNLLTSYF